MKALSFLAGVFFLVMALLNGFGLMGPVSYDLAWILFIGGGGVVLILYSVAG